MPESSLAELSLGEVVASITQANRAYYDGAPSISDDAYDALKEELKRRAPEHPLAASVGAPVNPTSALKKAKHRIPMGSLANGFDAKSIDLFTARVFAAVEEAGLGAPTAWMTQPKMDGFSIDLCYEGGLLKQAITRGDGVEGEDVTHNLIKAKGVPRALSQPLDISVNGEVVIHRDDFFEHFKGDANTRSSAAGTARRLDGHRAEFLQFYAFKAQRHDGKPFATTEQKVLAGLTELGFRIVPGTELVGGDTPEAVAINLKELWEEWKTLRTTMPFDCDGLVAKVSNLAKSAACGEADSCPRGMLAMKWRGSMTAAAEVVGLENSIGRTGAITPVAILRPVECGGVTITRVSLANWDEVARLGVGLGAKVIVERAGEVIPKITKVTTAGPAVFIRPSKCPSCSKATKVDGPRQVCTNPECDGQRFRRVYHWVQKRAIMHLGEEAVDALTALDGPVQCAADLYTVSMGDLEKACGGKAMAQKVAASLEASRKVALHEMVGSIGIPGLGATVVLKLCKGLQLDTLQKLLGVTFEEVSSLDGFDTVLAQKTVDGIDRWRGELLALAKHLLISSPLKSGGKLAGLTFCITGATSLPREMLKRIMTDAGAEWKSSVVKGLNVLIMAESDSNSTKAKAARAQGVRIITETEALDMAGYAP